MKIFRANTPEDITRDDLDNIRRGRYLQDPHDGFMWSAGTARRNQVYYPEYYDEGMSLRDVLKWIMLLALLTVFALAMYQGGVW